MIFRRRTATTRTQSVHSEKWAGHAAPKQNRQAYLEEKISELWDNIDDSESEVVRNEESQSRDPVDDAKVTQTETQRTEEGTEMSFQPVVISVFTTDAPRLKKTLTPNTTVTHADTFLNATMTEDSFLPPALRIIPVKHHHEWNDNETLTCVTDQYEYDDESEQTLSDEEEEEEDDHDHDGLSKQRRGRKGKKATGDELSVVPRPTDVIWNDLYRNCGIRTAEMVTDRLVVDLPYHVSRFFLCHTSEVVHEEDEASTEEEEQDSANYNIISREETAVKQFTRIVPFSTIGGANDNFLAADWDATTVVDYIDGWNPFGSDDHSEGKASF